MIGLILSREYRVELGAESQALDQYLDPEPQKCIHPNDVGDPFQPKRFCPSLFLLSLLKLMYYWLVYVKIAS